MWLLDDGNKKAEIRKLSTECQYMNCFIIRYFPVFSLHDPTTNEAFYLSCNDLSVSFEGEDDIPCQGKDISCKDLK